jgi:hypothetical protein
MIKKSLLTAAVILAMYHVVLPHLSHRFYQILGQLRGNHFRAQQYVHDVSDETNVIIGSSMSLALSEETLGPDYFKLTLPGGSVLTSLEIIRRANKRPAVVLIETNEMGKKVDHEFLHDLFNPWLFTLRNWSPIFREEGRPSNFVAGIAEVCVRKSSQWGSALVGRERTVNPSSQTDRFEPGLFSKLLNIYQEDLNHPPSFNELAHAVNQLAEYVDALIRSGSTCIFFEMPIDSSLSNLEGPRAVRRAIAERFPPAKYHWLSFDRGRNYETIDGIHLVGAEAEDLTEILVKQAAEITIR